MNQIERRKQTLIAHCDRLRDECGEIWSAAGRRAEIIEDARLGRLQWMQPLFSFVSIDRLLFLRESLPGGKGKFLGPVLSVATFAMDLSRRSRPERGRRNSSGKSRQQRQE